jgi:selenide, water dikinase
VLGGLSVPESDRVLVDYRTADDAGVYKLDEHRALVQTVDFFTPIVDDPFTYGQIAAANALSDVYAMGGRPLTALAVAGFPKDLDRAVLTTIFAGGLEMLQRAGVALLGGHTVQDQEIKFGYAVTGEVDPVVVRTYQTRPHGTHYAAWSRGHGDGISRHAVNQDCVLRLEASGAGHWSICLSDHECHTESGAGHRHIQRLRGAQRRHVAVLQVLPHRSCRKDQDSVVRGSLRDADVDGR